MEALTKLHFAGSEIEGNESVKAWCPGCKTWIEQVEIIENCHPYNLDYVMCRDCHTGIIRSS